MGAKLSSESSQSHAHDSSISAASPVPGHSNGEASGRTRHSFHSGSSNGQPSMYSDAMIFSGTDGEIPESRFMRAHSVVEGVRIPGGHHGLHFFYSNPDDENGDAANNHRARFLLSQSLPPYMSRRMMQQDSKCPMCKKVIPADDVEIHFVMCLTKPRVTYNEDSLSSAAGECAICLDDMEEGDSIARLPCLCIYHKKCIDEWFQTSQTCPEHPPD